jgi:23S rRNA (adenine1618-N6)-methyltransferase
VHSSNPFLPAYDFDKLTKAYPPLKPFVFVNEHHTETILFGDKNSVKALNTALLKAEYGVNWNLPENNLCPPIPGRLDYLLYVADLIEKPNAKLLDIGSGANLIYPILATRQLNWKCTGSEVDSGSLKHAQQLIDKNPSLKSIELRFQKFRGSIFNHLVLPEDQFDVVVCNPPFFKSAQDAHAKNQRKVKNLNLKSADPLNFGGQANELWYKGGEEAFVKKMAAESAEFKDQIHWFTSLISQKENLSSIKRAIKKTNPTDIRVIEMELGNKKSRIIAWTFR